MKLHMFTRFLALLLLISLSVLGQDLTPWSNNRYGNEWLDHSKKYLRVSVSSKGMQKLSQQTLNQNFPGVPLSQFQLFYRGQEVSMGLSGDGGLLFYGTTNDGAGDGLLYRPGPEARLNPHESTFSDLGTFFLTTSTGTVKRFPAPIDGTVLSGVAEPYHIQNSIRSYHTKLSKHAFGIESSSNPSYYNDENSWSSEAAAGAAGRLTSSVSLREINIADFNLVNWINTPSFTPSMEILVTGMNEGTHLVSIAAGSSSSNLSNLLTLEQFSGYKAKKATVEVPASFFGSNGEGYMRLTSNTTNFYDWFGLGYFTLTYPQKTDMNINGATSNSYVFNFKKSAAGRIRASIANSPVGALLFDISDPYNPKPYSAVQNGSNIDVMLSVLASTNFNLLVTSPSAGITTISDVNVKTVNFKPLYANYKGDESLSNVVDPTKYDFLIITHNVNPTSGQAYPEYVNSSINYAKYRTSLAGGGYNSLVVDIRDLYDQFNFGEPSPLGIRRFVDYMLQGSSARPKHNVLLLGASVSYPMSITKEMNGEIPTLGDPGSDVLLVAGLSGSDIDVQSVPIGRVSAFNHSQIDAYLAKVQQYESYTDGVNLDWRKNIINLNGASNSYEYNSFNTYFDYVKTNYIPNSQWSTINFKGTDAPTYASVTTPSSDVQNWINNGAGFISYFGHGSKSRAYLNVGKISDPGYVDNNKLSLFYLNGCDANDLFFTKSTHYFTTDWLLTPNRGAIAVLSTSYLAYHPDATAYHMYPFYDKLFNNPSGKTIGTILKEVSENMVGSSSGRVLAATDRTRIHLSQLILQGDPAVVLLKTSNPLPVELANFDAKLLDNGTVKIIWKTTWEKNNSHFIVERSKDAKTFIQIGVVDGKGESSEIIDYSFIDSTPNIGYNYYRLVQVDQAEKDGLEGIRNASRMVSVEFVPVDAINIFPNPISDQVDIKLDARIIMGSWSIIDAQGIVLKRGNGTTCDVSDLSKGLYILEMVSQEGLTYRKKLVKE